MSAPVLFIFFASFALWRFYYKKRQIVWNTVTFDVDREKAVDALGQRP